MTTPPMMPQDVVFRRAFQQLPQPLRDAMTDAELNDPGLLRAYPRSTAAQLGLGDHAPPLDSRRRMTRKGGGGGGLASAELDTVVEDGTDAADGAMGIYCGMGTPDVGMAGGMGLSSISGSVPVVSRSSSPLPALSPSFPSIFPIDSSVVMPEGGAEELTARIAQDSRGLVSAVESTSSGAEVKVIPRGTALEEKKCATMTARAGKKKREQKAVSRAKVASQKSEKPVGFTEFSRGAENSKCESHSGCQPEEFSPRVQALISGPPGGISLSFEPVENSRSRSHSSCQPDEFLPRSEALIREPTGGSDLS